VKLVELSVQGFKCFEATPDLPLAPLTLLFGRNNSGKSTLLQPLLLLKQTIERPDLGPRLNTRGTLYPGGTFTDLVHKHVRNTDASFRFGLVTTDPDARFSFLFRRDPSTGAPRVQELIVKRPGVDPLIVKRGTGKGGPYELRIGDRQLGIERRANFVLGEARFLPLIGEEPPRVGKPNQRNIRARAASREALRSLEQLLMSSRAVAAFRRAPERRHEFEGREPVGPDPAGEQVAQVLIADVRRRRDPGKLLSAINRWLRVLAGVRIEVAPVAQDIRIFELRVTGARRGVGADNLADVGFGIGQALPVLVEGLRTPRGGILLVQEPEIHLHPDAQIAMADFLLDLVKTGRQVVVETHSEALLLRVRRRIAETGRGGLEPNAVRLHVVEQDGTGVSRVRTLLPDQLGQLKGWPAGFMDETSEERLGLLTTMAGAGS
jgi:predicted ATPase